MTAPEITVPDMIYSIQLIFSAVCSVHPSALYPLSSSVSSLVGGVSTRFDVGGEAVLSVAETKTDGSEGAGDTRLFRYGELIR